MKILNVNHLIDPITGGGTAERTFQLSRFLAKTDVQCSLLTSAIGITEQRLQQLSGIEILTVSCLSQRFFIPKHSFRAIWRLVKKNDVIHLMGHWTILNAIVYLFAQFQNKPYVICPAGALPIFGRSKLLKKIYNWIIGKQIVNNAAGHIAITRDEIAHFDSYGVDTTEIEIIPNGIDPAQYSCGKSDIFRDKYTLQKTPFILFLGRLNSIKGPDLLLNAFTQIKDQYPDIHIVFAGPDGGMLNDLLAFADKKDLTNRVHFIGYIEGETKSQAYHAAELLVIPSRSEAMSIVALEAGISGTPVLLTDQCGFDEIEEVGGGIAVPATVEGLRAGLAHLLDRRNDLKPMGEKLKKHISENYLWEAITLKYLYFYQKIL